jgi:1,4-dihydroxy-6-naphthoate synthase
MLSLAYSPCPNDTFIFDALVHQRFDTQNLTFDVHLHDVETLNRAAFDGLYDITKLSYRAWCAVADQYQLLSAGSALGRGVGPLLISRSAQPTNQPIAGPVAIPGRYTTAHLLFSLAYPHVTNKVEMPFHLIEQAVLDGSVAAGVIIHENRFTYAARGLHKIVDLGDWWEQHTGAAIPLGGIAVHRRVPLEQQSTINQLIRRSVEFAWQHPEASRDYICQHAQEMLPEVQSRHIQLYVNEFSADLGAEGRQAIKKLVILANTQDLLPHAIDSGYYEVLG